MFQRNQKKKGAVALRNRKAIHPATYVRRPIYTLDMLEPRVLLSVNPGQIFAGGPNAIGEYSASGAVENASLVTGALSGPSGIAVSGSDLFVSNAGTGTIAEYTTSGATVNPSLISGINPSAIVASGSDLFVLNQSSSNSYVLAEYTTAGALVNPTLITGLSNFTQFAVSGADIFLSGDVNVQEYTTAGALVNASLISAPLGASGIAVSGSNLFVGLAVLKGYVESDTIAEFTTSGASVNSSVVSGLAFDAFGVLELGVSGSDILVLDDVASSRDSTIGEYTASGRTVNAQLFQGLPAYNQFTALAVSGTNLFTADYGAGTVSEYTIFGQTVNESLLPPTIEPTGIAASGTELFVAQYNNGNLTGTVGEYTTSGATVTESLIAGLDHPTAIAVSGTDLFVSNGGASSAGSIAEYTTAGQTVNATLITGLSYPTAIAVSGSDLFVLSNGTVGEYTATGAVVNRTLISGAGGLGLAIAGSDLFTYNGYSIAEYTTSGSVVNASLVSGLNDPLDFAAAVAAYDASGAYSNSLLQGEPGGLCVEAPQTIGPASQVVFGQRPIGAIADAAASPVTVAVEDANGSVITDDSSNVTVSIAAGPAGATLSGTTTVSAAGGVATFNDLSFSQPGAYTLTASDGTLSSGVSVAFQVNAAAGQSQLVPRFGKVDLPITVISGMNFPATVLTGAKLRLNAPVIITNYGSAFKGAVTIDIYADTGTGLDGNQALILPATKHLSLGAGKSQAYNFTVTSLAGVIPDRSYHLLVDIIDSTGADSEAAAPGTIGVSAGFTQPHVSVGNVVPVSIAAGKSGSLMVTIANQGDAAGAGVDITLSPSADGMTPIAGIILASMTSGIKIPPAKSRTFRLHFTAPSALPAGSYHPYLSVSLGGVVATAVGTKQFAIT